MRRYVVNFISGHTLKYKSVVVIADSEEDAVDKAFREEGKNFDNSLVSVHPFQKDDIDIDFIKATGNAYSVWQKQNAEYAEQMTLLIEKALRSTGLDKNVVNVYGERGRFSIERNLRIPFNGEFYLVFYKYKENYPDELNKCPTRRYSIRPECSKEDFLKIMSMFTGE